MTISVDCPCGATFKVRDEYAGKKGQCPTCGTVVVIPTELDPETPDEDDEWIDEDELEDVPTTSRRAKRKRSGGGTFFAGISHGLLGLTRQSGLLLMASGLVLALLSRGCDTTGVRSIAAIKAEYELEQNSFRDGFEEEKLTFQRQIDLITEEISQINETANSVREERFGPDRREGFDYDEELKRLNDRVAEKQEVINEQREKMNEVSAREQKERATLRTGDWKKYEIAMRDAQARNIKSGWWRAWMFNIGTVCLAIGLLTLASTGEKFERIASLTMIAIITFSLYVGGLAWMDTVMTNVSSFMGR